jgi:signal transduction histidine kinase
VVVVLLAVALCAVAIVSLVRIVGITVEQRLQRARTVLAVELEAPSNADMLAYPDVVGMRAGLLRDGKVTDRIELGVPAAREALRTMAAVTHIGATEIVEVPTDDGVLVIGTRGNADGSVRWMSYPVRTSRFSSLVRTVVVAISCAAAALALVTIGAIVAMTRDTRSLRGALRDLAGNLSAPVPRPLLGEMAEIADGVTALSRSLAEAERSRDELTTELGKRERLAALGRVAAGVAHEVRNPLTAMKLRLDLLRSGGEVGADVARELGTVSEEISRLDRLVGDLLVVAGRRHGPREDTDLAALTAERARQLQLWADEHGVRLVTAGTGRAHVSRDGIARAVDNLLRNAVEASPRGAPVEVTVRGDGDNGSVVVTVEDAGDGVPVEREEELFEPFFTTKPHGTGLGLALCRAVALSEGGSVRYARRNERTCFELTLPTQA